MQNHRGDQEETIVAAHSKCQDKREQALCSHVGKHDTPCQSERAILGAEASAELRDRLIAELNDLGSNDDAAIWAHRRLREKNRLTAADAQSVEEIFQARLATLAAGAADLPEIRE